MVCNDAGKDKKMRRRRWMMGGILCVLVYGILIQANAKHVPAAVVDYILDGVSDQVGKEETTLFGNGKHITGSSTQKKGQEDTKIESVQNENAQAAEYGVLIENENQSYLSQNQEQPVKSTVKTNLKQIQALKSTKRFKDLISHFYIVDRTTSVDPKILNVEDLLSRNLEIEKSKKPQILIYHTHGASEAFVSPGKSRSERSVISVGELLAEYLRKEGYVVLHDTTPYDRIHGKIDRNKAYNQAYKGVTRYLNRYPSLQVLIDLHRDGVGQKVHRTTVIDGKSTAQVMFFNGLSRNTKGNIPSLKNKNLKDNLAFSLQMRIKCMEQYADFAKPVYLKGYRYNLHLRKRSLLIELGNENNTLQEARNAMKPLAGVLDQVLSGK